jgi:hypothetical protein
MKFQVVMDYELENVQHCVHDRPVHLHAVAP